MFIFTGGKLGCRRCLVNGTYIPENHHYYYGYFRNRYRNPCVQKSNTYLLENGKKVDDALTVTERKQLQTETGVAGLTVLAELHKLYAFDPVRDMVIDRMHVAFNMLKREFVDLIWADMGENSVRPVNNRDPKVGGLVNRNEFASALDAVVWPREEKASGVARVRSLTDKMGGWKSNDYKK